MPLFSPRHQSRTHDYMKGQVHSCPAGSFKISSWLSGSLAVSLKRKIATKISRFYWREEKYQSHYYWIQMTWAWKKNDNIPPMVPQFYTNEALTKSKWLLEFFCEIDTELYTRMGRNSGAFLSVFFFPDLDPQFANWGPCAIAQGKRPRHKLAGK